MAIQRTLAKSCCKGLKGPQVTGKIINKVRVAMHIHLQNLSEKRVGLLLPIQLHEGRCVVFMLQETKSMCA